MSQIDSKIIPKFRVIFILVSFPVFGWTVELNSPTRGPLTRLLTDTTKGNSVISDQFFICQASVLFKLGCLYIL